MPLTEPPPTRQPPPLIAVCLLHAAALVASLALSLFLIGDALPAAGYFRDLNLYFGWSSQVLRGLVPYRDFAIEYPPVSLLLFFLPRLFASNIYSYAWMFGLFMIACSTATAAAIYRYSLKAGADSPLPRVAWFTLCLLILTPLPTSRFDIVPALLAFWAAQTAAGGQHRASSVAAALGAAIKIFPGLVIVSAAAFARQHRPFVLRLLATFIAVVAVIACAWILLAPVGALESFRYHAGRGLQVETLYSGIAIVAALSSSRPISTQYASSAFDLVSPWSSSVAAVSFPMQILAIGVSLYVFTVRRSGLMHTCAGVFLAFIVFGKVLSSQYLMWILPFISVLPARVGSHARILTLLACVLTTIVDPWLWQPLLQFQLAPVMLLNFRNLTLLGLWILLLLISAPPPSGSASPQ